MKKTNLLSTAIIKRSGALILILTLAMVLFSGCIQTKQNFILATTTSLNDSGLLYYLKPELEKDTNLNVKIVAQGTGQAVKTAQDGNADCLFIHDKKTEERFVASGYGKARIELMYNYFVIVGPKEDPARVKDLNDKKAASAFKSIMKGSYPFVSRGDDSGTHKKELTIWTAAEIKPQGDWYKSAGKGMGDVLMMASELNAYALTDKATYLSMKDKLGLEIMLENAQDMLNQYTVIALNPEKLKNVNDDANNRFVKWITSKKALDMINSYGKDKYKEPLFVVNYKNQAR